MVTVLCKKVTINVTFFPQTNILYFYPGGVHCNRNH
jgi:hypothetical protein